MKTSPSKVSKTILSPDIQLALAKRVCRRARLFAPKVALRGAAGVLALFALFGFNPQTLAATDTWVGNTSVNWADSNWAGTGNNPPQTGDSLVFGAAGSFGTSLTDNLMTPGTFSIGTITFNAGAPAYTITSGTAGVNGFTLTGGIDNASTVLQTINDSITVTAAPTTLTTTTGGGNINIGGAISGAGGISTAGPGTVTLSASDSYTGATTIGAGSTLSLTGGINGSAISSGSSAFIESATGTINGGSLTLFTTTTGGTATLAGINNTGNITVGVTAGATEANPGQFQITGGSTVSTGTIALRGYSGAGSTAPATVPMLVVTGGTLSAVAYTTGIGGNESGNGATITGSSVVSFGSTTDGNSSSDGGTFTIGTTGVPETGTVSLGNYIIGRNGGVTQAPTTTSGLIINSGSVTAVSINSSNLGTTDIGRVGDINLNGGSLTITAATGGFGLGNATDSGNDFLDMSGGTLTYAGSDGLLTSEITNNGTANDSYTGIVITGGTATLTGITLNSTSAAFGHTSLAVNSGATVYLGSVGLVLNQVAGATVTATLGTATVGATAPWSSSANIALVSGDTTTFQSANAALSPNSISLSGTLSGGGGINATGSGTLTLSGVNTYTGNTAVAPGATLAIAGAGSLGTGGAYAGNLADNGTFSYGSSATQSFSGVVSGTGAINITAGTVAISGAGTVSSYTGSIANGSAFSYGSSANQTLSGPISGVGTLTVAGTGKLTLGGSNSYTGATNVTGGGLILNSSTPLGNTAVTVASGASLQASPSLGAVAIGSAGGASLALNGGSTLLLGGATAGTAETTTFNTLTLNGGLTIGGPTSTANLDFDLNGTSNDKLVVTGALSFGTDGGVINIVVPSISTAPSGASQTYTLVTAGSGLTSTAGFSLAGTGIVALGGNSYAASLGESGGALTLTLNEVTVSYYWVGGTSASWSVPGNFATDHTGVAFQSGQLAAANNVILTADSPSGTHTASQTLDNSYTINSLSYSSTAPATNLGTGSGGGGSSNTLTLDAASGFGVTVGSTPVTTTYGSGIGIVMQNGSAAQTLNVPIVLGNSQTWEIDNATNALTVQGVISDGGAGNSLTKTGVGTLIFQNAETYTGGTIVSGGTLQLGTGGSLPSTSPVTVQGTGTFDLAGNSQTVGNLSDGSVATGTITSSSGAAMLTVNNTAADSFSGTITDNNAGNGASLALALVGAGNVTLSGSNNFTGGVALTGNSLTVSNNYGLGTVTSTNANAGLVMNPAGGATSTAYFTSANPHLAQLSSGGAGGTSDVVLGNTSGTPSATTLNVGDGADTAITNYTFSGIISDLSATNAAAIGNLNVNNGGFLILAGANTFTGTTTITGAGSELELQNALALQDSTLNYNNQGGTIAFSGITTLTLAGLTGAQNLALTNTGSAPVALTLGHNNAPNTFTGSLTGSGNLTTVNTAGVITLTNDNLTGNLTVGAGQATSAVGGLTITGGSFGSSGSTLLYQSSQALGLDISGGTATFGTVSIVPVGGNTGGGFEITGNGSAVFGSVQIGSNANTGGELLINTTGTVALGAYVEARDGAAGGAANAAGGIVLTTGTVTATSILPGTGVGGRASDININGGSLTIGNSSSSAAFELSGAAEDGIITQAGGTLTYLGTDGLLASVGNDASAINLNGGIANLSGITLDAGNTATEVSTLLVHTGATLYLGSVGLNEGTDDTGVTVTLGTATIGALASWSTSVPLTLTTGDTTTFDAANAIGTAENITLNGAISNGGGIAKIGAGQEVLSALNNYTGATTVNAGTLEVSGSLSATASVGVNNATLELAANNALYQSAPITLNSGVLQVLASQSEALGTLTLNGGASTLSLGASSDVINFADSSALAWTGTLAISDWNGASAGGGSDEVFIGATNDLTSAQLADVSFLNPVVDGVTFNGTYGADQLTSGELVAAIPEPGTWAMMLAGAGMLCVWQRSRRRVRKVTTVENGVRSA